MNIFRSIPPKKIKKKKKLIVMMTFGLNFCPFIFWPSKKFCFPYIVYALVYQCLWSVKLYIWSYSPPSCSCIYILRISCLKGTHAHIGVTKIWSSLSLFNNAIGVMGPRLRFVCLHRLRCTYATLVYLSRFE